LKNGERKLFHVPADGGGIAGIADEVGHGGGNLGNISVLRKRADIIVDDFGGAAGAGST